MHLDEERLQRLLHGEFSSTEEKRAREHLTDCGECSRRFRAMEREEKAVGELLGSLDRPAPRVDFSAIARRGEARSPSMARWAAGLALVLGLTGVAYALPGSPLPRWVDAVVEWASGRQDPSLPAGASLESPDSSFAGIAVPPGNDLLILFTSTNAKGHLLVTLTESADVEIRAPRGAATFTSGEDRLLVGDQGSAATYEIRIPHTAPRVEILVGENRVFLKEGSRVTTAASTGGSAPYLLPMSLPGP